VDLAHFDSPEHLIEDEQDDKEENIMNLIGADGGKPQAAVAAHNQAHDDSFCNIVELQGGGDIGKLDEELINFQPALEE